MISKAGCSKALQAETIFPSFNNRWQLAYWLCAVAILGLLYVAWPLSRVIYVLSALIAITCLIPHSRISIKEHWLFSLPIILFVFSNAISVGAHGFEDRAVNILVSRYSLILLAIPLAIFFSRNWSLNIDRWFPFIVGGIAIGAIAIIEVYWLDKNRASAGYNAVEFGFVCASISSLLLASLFSPSHSKYFTFLKLVAFTLSLLAMLLSGTRGAWAASLVSIIIIMFFLMEKKSSITRLAIACFIIAGLIVTSLALTPVQKRANDMVKLLTPYLTNQQQSDFNSFRYRVETWKVTYQMGIKNSLTGIGAGNFRDQLKLHIADNPDIKQLAKIRHPHNQYLQSFVTAGLPALLAFVGLLTAHFILFVRYLAQHYPQTVRACALGGVIVIVSYAILSITGVPMYRKKLAVLYGISLAIFWSGILNFKLNNNQEPDTR